MPEKLYYHDLNLANVGQVKNFRIHNVTSNERATLAAGLGTAHKGLSVYDTDDQREYIWDGVKFVSQAIEVAGDVVFKGIVSTLNNPPNVEMVAGYEYVMDATGTLVLDGVTILPDAEVQAGDRLLVASPTEIRVMQRNDLYASETMEGNVRFASNSETADANSNSRAVHPQGLHHKLVTQGYVRQYTETVNLTAFTPKQVVHGLALVNKDAFTVNLMRNGSQVSYDVNSIDENTIEIEGSLSASNVIVTITGASTV